MRGQIKKWDDDAAVLIPADILTAARMQIDQPVEVREEHGAIVIAPVRAERYDRDTLIAAVTDENLHDPVDMGPPAGRETW